MASATPDLRLPFQLYAGTKFIWLGDSWLDISPKLQCCRPARVEQFTAAPATRHELCAFQASTENIRELVSHGVLLLIAVLRLRNTLTYLLTYLFTIKPRPKSVYEFRFSVLFHSLVAYLSCRSALDAMFHSLMARYSLSVLNYYYYCVLRAISRLLAHNNNTGNILCCQPIDGNLICFV